MGEGLVQAQDQFVSVPFELAALAQAKNYQRWVYRTVEPYLGRRILEIGAGIGNMSHWIPIRERLILTELDPVLLRILEDSVAKGVGKPDARVTVTSLDIMSAGVDHLRSENLDTVVSFNVLEHLENDEAALRRLCELVRSSNSPGPRRVVTFVPAHQWAYGSMDQKFGHFRRYSRRTLESLAGRVAPEARIHFQYFNLLGLFGWIWNGRVLRRPTIGVGAIELFETVCPWLSPIDDWIHRGLRAPIGQSLLMVLEMS